jgi:hypothetical protein
MIINEVCLGFQIVLGERPGYQFGSRHDPAEGWR